MLQLSKLFDHFQHIHKITLKTCKAITAYTVTSDIANLKEIQNPMHGEVPIEAPIEGLTVLRMNMHGLSLPLYKG